MREHFLLYYITDRTAFGGDEQLRRRRLLDKIAEAKSAGVDYLQLREKDLSAGELEGLARDAMRIIKERSVGTTARLVTALLINSRTDVALAAGAHGVHLPSDDVSPQDVRTAWQCARANGCPGLISPPLIGVSCHSKQDVALAAANHASFAVFAPVFEKKDAHPAGLEGLRYACGVNIPVLALGGVTLQNADACLQAGAAGIAAIRLFQENDIAAVVRALRR